MFAPHREGWRVASGAAAGAAVLLPRASRRGGQHSGCSGNRAQGVARRGTCARMGIACEWKEPKRKRSACASALMRGPASGVPVESADNSQFGPEFAILKAVKRTCISIITAQSLKRTCIPRPYKTIPVCDSRTSPLIACHASLIHHSVIPRLGLSVSHMT